MEYSTVYSMSLTEEKGVADDDPRHELRRVGELELGAAIPHGVNGLSQVIETQGHTPLGSIRCFFHRAAWSKLQLNYSTYRYVPYVPFSLRVWWSSTMLAGPINS